MPEQKSAERTIVNVPNVLLHGFRPSVRDYGSHLAQEIRFRELGGSENPP